jgi:4-amino-4-deoxy-L-arabinose transferase-like glycosyltransferase
MLPRVPAPLGALLAAVVIVGVAWALFVPPFQSPDETTHFAYAQSLVENFELPGKTGRPPYSTELLLAVSRSNSDQTAAVLATKPEWSGAAFSSWRAASDALPAHARKNGGGPISSSSNPPAYYLYEAIPYRIAQGGNLLDRLYLMRLWSLTLLLVTVVGTWLLAGELFGRQRLLQLTAGGVAGLQPMVTFLSASVNPDGLLFALWSLAFWLGVRILKRGLAAPEAVALFAIVGVAVVTKATSYALLPAVLFVLAVAARRRARARRAAGAAGGRVTTVLIAALVAFAVPAGAWLVTARALDRPAVNEVTTAPGRTNPTITSFSLRELGSYLWQYYLPKLSFQRRFGGMPNLPVYNIWLKGGWGRFGWLEVTLPGVVYGLLALLSAIFLVGAAVFVIRQRRTIDLAVLAYFAIAAFVLLAGLHWTEFRTLVGGTGPFNQGRYLLPLISLLGAAVAATIALLPERRRPVAAGLVLGGLVALQLASLAVVGGRFYA